MPDQPPKFAGVNDAAVKARTGKGWKEWFVFLDKIDARKMTHKEIAEHLHKKHKSAVGGARW